MFVDGKDSIGCPDNSQFMTTKDYMDKIVSESGGNVSAFEKSLGFDPEYFENREIFPWLYKFETILYWCNKLQINTGYPLRCL